MSAGKHFVRLLCTMVRPLYTAFDYAQHATAVVVPDFFVFAFLYRLVVFIARLHCPCLV
jgi:hypothetical protein